MPRGRSLATQIAKAQRDHAHLEVMLARKGLAAIDPDSEAGREVLELAELLTQACSKKRPAVIALQGVQMFVEQVILRRTLFTQIAALGGTVPTGSSRKAAAERSAWKAAMEAYQRCGPAMERACRLMGIEGFAEFSEKLGDDIGELNQHLRELRKRAEGRDGGGNTGGGDGGGSEGGPAPLTLTGRPAAMAIPDPAPAPDYATAATSAAPAPPSADEPPAANSVTTPPRDTD